MLSVKLTKSNAQIKNIIIRTLYDDKFIYKSWVWLVFFLFRATAQKNIFFFNLLISKKKRSIAW